MLSAALIKKWKNMLGGKSVLHTVQGEGAFYEIEGLEGYYNDLRGKALYSKNFDGRGIPIHTAAKGNLRKTIFFPIAIFQYGLGCYDEYLETKEEVWRQKLLVMARWALENQRPDGSYDAFGCLDYPCEVSSMAQGEACSLLARAYKETGDEAYREACARSAEFMLKEKEEGGTASYTNEGILLYEYPDKPLVLNGWIFSSFGLLDCYKITGEERFKLQWQETLKGIKSNLSRFDGRFWSMYETTGVFSSPFYHSLHISLLKALNTLDPSDQYQFYIDKWSRNAGKGFNRRYAFVRKAIQKLMEVNKTGWFIAE